MNGLGKKLLAGILIILVVSFVSLYLYFQRSPQTQEGEELKLRVGLIPSAGFLPFYVAQERGFFKEEGLDVEAKYMAGGAVIAPAVNAGDLDIGDSNTVSLIIAHSKGFDFKLLFPAAFIDSPKSHQYHMLLVPNESEIDSVEDLEGKTVAVNTLGNINELAVNSWVEEYNVDPSKINLVEIGFPHMENALENRKVDAALAIEPFVTLSLSHGTAKPLDRRPHDSISESFLLGGWFARESWLKENPRKAEAFVDAMRKATEYVNENPNKSRAILPNYTKLSKELSYKISLTDFKESIEKSEIQVLINSSRRYGFIDEKFPAEELIWENSPDWVYY